MDQVGVLSVIIAVWVVPLWFRRIRLIFVRKKPRPPLQGFQVSTGGLKLIPDWLLSIGWMNMKLMTFAMHQEIEWLSQNHLVIISAPIQECKGIGSHVKSRFSNSRSSVNGCRRLRLMNTIQNWIYSYANASCKLYRLHSRKQCASAHGFDRLIKHPKIL